MPTDEQWEEIKQNYSELGVLIKSKIPFVSGFQTALENAQNQVFVNNDFLTIKIPSISFFGGRTEEQTVINVKESYEPYREEIRKLLSWLVYGCGFVYLVKTSLNYKATAEGISVSENLKGSDK